MCSPEALTPAAERRRDGQWLSYSASRLEPWLAKSTKLEARKRDGRMVSADEVTVDKASLNQIEAIAADEAVMVDVDAIIRDAIPRLVAGGLTPRQATAYAAALIGQSDVEIASRLGISKESVSYYLGIGRRKARVGGLPPLPDRRSAGRRRLR